MTDPFFDLFRCRADAPFGQNASVPESSLPQLGQTRLS